MGSPSKGFVVFGPLAVCIILLLLQLIPHHVAEEALDPRAETFSTEPFTSSVGIPFGDADYSHNFTSSRLEQVTKRDDEAVDFDEYVCTGVKLLNMILLEPSPERRFGNADLTGAWVNLPDIAIRPNGISGVYGYLQPILQQLQIGTRFNVDFKINGMGQLIPFRDEHGVMHPPTRGHYRQEYFHNGGAIIGTDNFSPSYRGGPNAVLPRLHRWSDFTWVQWIITCATAQPPKPFHSLRYIFHDHIITASTRRIFEHIAGAEKDHLRLSWPGQKYGLDSEEGLALLATPHGKGAAYMVKDYQQHLGKTEFTIRMFTIQEYYYMLIDLKPDQPDDRIQPIPGFG
ncbi:MAG: hypothetical protein Q9183_005331 [Haloplaca sp. 2 TL-2023]